MSKYLNRDEAYSAAIASFHAHEAQLKRWLMIDSADAPPAATEAVRQQLIHIEDARDYFVNQLKMMNNL